MSKEGQSMSKIKVKNSTSVVGAIGEKTFLAEAMRNGFSVSEPALHSSPYDFVVDTGKRFLKVQVKSSQIRVDKGVRRYKFKVTHGGGGRGPSRIYKGADVDVFVLYAADLNLFYLIPFKDVKGLKMITIGEKDGKYEKYKNAWHVLK